MLPILAALLFAALPVAAAQRFVLPSGSDVASYCNATYTSITPDALAALDAKYEGLAPGISPFTANGGVAVCTLGCQAGRASAEPWAGKCWGLNGAPNFQSNCLSSAVCTVRTAKALLASGTLPAGIVTLGDRSPRWLLTYPPGSDGARAFDALEALQVPGQPPVPGGRLFAAYYADAGARTWHDFHDEFKQLEPGVWLGRIYVDQANGVRKLARRFVFFLV
jgi:hypothetical protein